MARYKLKNYFQKHFDLEKNRCFKLMRPFIKDKNLWHINRYSISSGLSIGIFSAWIPMPFHTIIAIFLALAFDCNVPIAVISIWVANPLTMPEMYYFAYQLGSKLLDIKINFSNSTLDIPSIIHLLDEIWEPLILGCLICGIVSAVVIWIVVQLLWGSIIERFILRNKDK